MRTVFNAALLVSVALLAACGDAKKETAAASVSYGWEVEEMPLLCVSDTQGVAGALATMVDGRLVVAGGANFPDTPAANGGKKRVYSQIYALADGGERWELSGDLSAPIAYAAAVMTPKGLVYVGGNNGERSVDEVCLLSCDGSRQSLTAYPRPVENAAAAYAAGDVYVFGGQTPEGASRECWSLSIDDEKAQWRRVADLPSDPRVQCSATFLDGKIYVAGGYNPTDGTVNATLVAYDMEKDEWQFVDSLRRPGEQQTATLVGGSLVADSASHRLLFIGGVDATIFYEAISRPMRLASARNEGNKAMVEKLEQEQAEYMHHEPAWYNFNDRLISYDFGQHEYVCELSHPALARAGAAVLQCDSVIYVVNGELKPGIRANTALMLKRIVR